MPPHLPAAEQCKCSYRPCGRLSDGCGRCSQPTNCLPRWPFNIFADLRSNGLNERLRANREFGKMIAQGGHVTPSIESNPLTACTRIGIQRFFGSFGME